MNDPVPPSPVIHSAFKIAFKVVSHLFFREIKTTGEQLVPVDSPCIFIVGPHANQFVDGMVFLSNVPRHSYAIMASVSYNKPFIGHVGKILSAIPVVRPQDIVNRGAGKVSYEAPFVIRGDGTCFTEQVAPRDFILFGRNYKGHVARVISDTELHITHAIPTDDTSFYDYKIAPHVDQTSVYREVHDYLNNNECITIFPEGGSHDRPEMLPLKAGFAVMALGAMAENPNLDLKIVPVGMNYFHPDKFRSRAVVSFAPPLSIDREDVEKFKKGGLSKREAVTKLMDQSDEAFRTVTINAPDYDTLVIIQAARRLYRPSTQKGKISIDEVVKLNRNFVSGWSKLKDEPRIESLTRKIKLYNDTLSFFGIRDHQVDKLDITPARAASMLVRRLMKLMLLCGVGAPAMVSNLPLIWITKFISEKKQKEALAGSMVKIAGKDVLATWKILVAVFVAPALYGFYALLYLGYLVRQRPDLSRFNKLVRAGIVWGVQPILHYALMRLGDTGLDIYKSIKPLFLAVRNPEVGRILRIMRNDLSRDITAFVHEYKSVFLPDEHVPKESNGKLLDLKSEEKEQDLNTFPLNRRP